MTYEEEMRQLSQAIREGTKKITRTPETAKAYLVELGVVTPDGKLTPEYGGEPDEESDRSYRLSRM